jgi:hypothetical protein
MTFLAPWAAWCLAGVPVIVLLYLLKLKRRPVTVSTLLFWERLMQENRQRALFQKLRHLLSLLLHLLIFLLIVAALAKPALDRRVRDGSSLVLVVDARARMQAREADGRTRIERAIEEARRFAREAGQGRQMAVLSAGASANVVVPFTGDERELLKGIASITATDAGGQLEDALALAQSLLASRKGDSRIVVLTDTARVTQPSTLNPHLLSIPCGSAHDNVAITRFATRPLLTSPQTSEVLLAIKNFGRTPASGNVEIAFDGKLLDVKPFTLEPGKEHLETFASIPRASRKSRGWLTARLDKQDALAADNVAYAVLPAADPHRVLLVSKGNWFLEKLLAADQRMEFELIDPGAWQPDFARKFDAIVCDNFLPPGFDLAQSVGNFLFLKQSPFTTNEPAIELPLVTEMTASHPAMRLVSLQNVTILRAADAKLPEPDADWKWEAPLKSFDHPLLITGSRSGASRLPVNGGAGGTAATPTPPTAGTAVPQQRIAALSFDVGDSDLPLRIAFPLLMSNTIHWLAGEAPETITSAIAGENIALAPGAAHSTEPLTDPKADIAVSTQPAANFQPLRNGFHLVRQPSGASWVAVNTFSEAESDLRTAAEGPPPAPTARTLPLPGLADFTAWPLWQYLALAALVLFAIEWWLFHRRRTE